MSVTPMREWSCDNLCGRTETHPHAELCPDGWVAMKWNSRLPLGSMDADGWRSAVLCAACWSDVEDALDYAVNVQTTEAAP